LAPNSGTTKKQCSNNKGSFGVIVMGKIYFRSEAPKDWAAADYPEDLCFFNSRFSRQVVELEMKRLKRNHK